MFQKIKNLSIFLIFLFLVLILPSFKISAQTDPSQERQALEEELSNLEEQIAKYDEDISRTSQAKKTLQDQINILKKQIAKLNLQAQQSGAMIKDLGIQLGDTQKSIEQTALKIKNSRIQLASILKSVNEEDQKSLIEVLLYEKELSVFFNNLMALEALNSKAQALLSDVKDLKIYLESQKQSLEDEKGDLEKVLKIQVLQKKNQESIQKDKDYFLKLNEAQYQEYLKGKNEVEKKAAEIRARIFELIGVPEAPTFGAALDIANYVNQIIGVKSALLLAVLTQESNIGKNVGQCFLKNLSTGAGVRVSSNGASVKNVMSPTRDVPHFLAITKGLNRDLYNTPVSCPMSIGYGGGMGPAQFIPSTWQNYGQKVENITGRPADPWNIKDAFLAAGLYLKDLGAQTNEFKAVMRYFSGNTWSKWEEFYGNSVLSLKAKYEDDIKQIGGLQ